MMREAMKKAIVVLVAVFLGISLSTAGNLPVFAENAWTSEACASADADQRAALGCDDNNQTAPIVVTNLLQVIVSVLGIVAVIVIIFAGQRFITAQGDPAQVKNAQGMLLYALIGLVVAILAFAIISFLQAEVFS